ncbi:7981_t:CDS:2 [Entrophospora sp. SA101]|nr:7981_t:CDS:2 [Entrophospora sp. SA101]
MPIIVHTILPPPPNPTSSSLTLSSANDFNCIESNNWMEKILIIVMIVFQLFFIDINNYLMNKALLIEDVEKPSELVHRLHGLGIIRPLMYEEIVAILNKEKEGGRENTIFINAQDALQSYENLLIYIQQEEQELYWRAYVR